jgi:O-antigen ligase|tara:strand:- start:1694 stop:2908 length:1215 start_codon:yes stop_codon:yes gene_type:complete
MKTLNLPTILYALAIGSLAWSRAAHSALSLLAIVLFFIQSPQPIRLGRLPYLKHLLAVLGLIAFSCLYADDFSLALDDIGGMWPIIHLFLAPFILQNKNMKAFTFIVVGVATLGGMFSIFQELGFISYKSKVSGNVATSDTWAFVDCLTYAIPVAFFVTLQGNKIYHKLFLLPVFIMTYSLWITQQRANFIAAACCIVIVALLHNRSSKKIRTMVLATIVVAAALITTYSDSAIGDLDDVFTDNPAEFIHPLRAAQYEIALEAIEQSPVIGHGFGSYTTFERDFIALNPEAEKILGSNTGIVRVHNNIMHTLVSSGIVGLIIASCLFFKILWHLLKHVKSNNQAALLGISACAIHFITGLTDYPSYYSKRLAIFTIAIGFAYGALLSTEREALNNNPEPTLPNG